MIATLLRHPEINPTKTYTCGSSPREQARDSKFVLETFLSSEDREEIKALDIIINMLTEAEQKWATTHPETSLSSSSSSTTSTGSSSGSSNPSGTASSNSFGFIADPKPDSFMTVYTPDGRERTLRLRPVVTHFESIVHGHSHTQLTYETQLTDENDTSSTSGSSSNSTTTPTPQSNTSSSSSSQRTVVSGPARAWNPMAFIAANDVLREFVGTETATENNPSPSSNSSSSSTTTPQSNTSSRSTRMENRMRIEDVD